MNDMNYYMEKPEMIKIYLTEHKWVENKCVTYQPRIRSIKTKCIISFCLKKPNYNDLIYRLSKDIPPHDITNKISLAFHPTGVLFISSSVRGSVARARARSVSIIMLTHKSWMTVRGALPGYVKNKRVVTILGLYISEQTIKLLD